jgi:hypothetical protein
MKLVSKCLVLIAAVIFLPRARADASAPYDYCDGSFPAGSFSEEAQRFSIQGEGSYLNIHLEGPIRHDDFDSSEAELRTTAQARTYLVRPVVSGEEFAELRIDLAQCDPAFDADANVESSCPAVLTTNVSGKKRSLSIGCSVNRRDYSAPPDPWQCRTHCI